MSISGAHGNVVENGFTGKEYILETKLSYILVLMNSYCPFIRETWYYFKAMLLLGTINI